MLQPETSPRDYTAEFRQAINDAMDPDSFVPGIVAQRVVHSLRYQDPDLLVGFLLENAPALVTQYIIQTNHRRRGAARRSAARAEEFNTGAKTASKEHKAGSPQALQLFYQSVRLENGQFKAPSEMTANEHHWLSEYYLSDGNRKLLISEFHRQIAMKISEAGVTTAAEVWSAEDYDHMFASIVK